MFSIYDVYTKLLKKHEEAYEKHKNAFGSSAKAAFCNRYETTEGDLRDLRVKNYDSELGYLRILHKIDKQLEEIGSLLLEIEEEEREEGIKIELNYTERKTVINALEQLAEGERERLKGCGGMPESAKPLYDKMYAEYEAIKDLKERFEI